MQRRALLGTGFGEKQAAIWKIESCETTGARHLDAAGAPVQASGDHEVQHQPQIVVQPNGDPFADPAELSNGFVLGAMKRRVHGAQEKRTCETDMLEGLAEDALFE